MQTEFIHTPYFEDTFQVSIKDDISDFIPSSSYCHTGKRLKSVVVPMAKGKGKCSWWFKTSVPTKNPNSIFKTVPISCITDFVNKDEAHDIINTSYSHADSLELICRQLCNDVESMADLEEDWDGEGAREIPRAVILHAKHIFRCTMLFNEMVNSIYPTSFGSICIDWENSSHDRVSIEIGRTEISYYYMSEDSVESIFQNPIPLKKDSIDEFLCVLSNL